MFWYSKQIKTPEKAIRWNQSRLDLGKSTLENYAYRFSDGLCNVSLSVHQQNSNTFPFLWKKYLPQET